MQEEIENRTVNLAVTTTRLSGRVLMDALRMYLRHRDLKKSRNQQTKDDHPHGEQTVKDLIGQNQGVTSILLDDIRIRDFSQAARKYGVDFAVTKDKTITPPRYVVFFKARDTDALKQILGELTQKQLNQKDRPSLIKQLAKIKNMVKAIPSKARRHEQEHDR